MSELPKTFDPTAIEQHWYDHWESKGLFRPERPDEEPWTIVMPPPNVTGSLHIGHALDNTLQDILTRRERMRGKDALWVVGTDHAGIATQTGSGLMVPVLRHAEAHDLWSAAAEISRLAEAARSAKAARDELSGSTITITSLGPLGGIVTTPVINHPEVAIVGVNRIVERPMVRDGAVVIRKMMNLSSSFDHRVVDGMDAAQFIQAIRALLECPAMLFVE